MLGAAGSRIVVHKCCCTARYLWTFYFYSCRRLHFWTFFQIQNQIGLFSRTSIKDSTSCRTFEWQWSHGGTTRRIRESVKRRGSGEWIGWTKDMSIEYLKKVILPKFLESSAREWTLKQNREGIEFFEISQHCLKEIMPNIWYRSHSVYSWVELETSFENKF